MLAAETTPFISTPSIDKLATEAIARDPEAADPFGVSDVAFLGDCSMGLSTRFTAHLDTDPAKPSNAFLVRHAFDELEPILKVLAALITSSDEPLLYAFHRDQDWWELLHFGFLRNTQTGARFGMWSSTPLLHAAHNNTGSKPILKKGNTVIASSCVPHLQFVRGGIGDCRGRTHY